MERQRYIDEHLNVLFAERCSQTAAWWGALFFALAAFVYAGGWTPGPAVFTALIATSLALFGVSLAGRRIQPEHAVAHHLFAYAAVSFSAAAVEFLILTLDGPVPAHAAGMTLLGFCAAGFIVAPMSFHAISAGLIYAAFALSVLRIDPIADFRVFLAANALMIVSLSSAVLMGRLIRKNIAGGFGLRYDLDRRQVLLEEDVKGQAAQLNATILDLKGVIAARKKAEQELRESEKKYRLVVEAAGEGILVAQDGMVKFANSSLVAMTGYPQEVMIGRPFLDFVHPDDRELVTRQHEKRLTGELPPESSYWFRLTTRNGAVRWAEIRGALTAWEGNPATVSFISDVTERKKAEDALRESEAKFRTLFEESKDVFFISTPDGRLLDINPAGIELFGYSSKEEILSADIGRDLYVSPRDRRKFLEVMNKMNYVKEYEVPMKRKNGERLTGIITSSSIRDDQGGLLALRGIIRDVTEQRQLEQQLLQSQKMEAVGQLAGGIAHDFNNILTAIVGYANLLQMKLPQNDPLASYVEHVLASADRASSLTHSLLAFSRKQVMNPKPIDINEVIRKVEKLLVRLIGEDIDLDSELSPEELIVVADGLQIEQVLMNLATNARDSMPRGGRLTIETHALTKDGGPGEKHPNLKPGDYAVIAVMDTGTGMDDKTREKIFEPFFTTKEVGKGTGLGLAMVYGIVKQHSGHIDVISEPGEGTRFEIYLPTITQRTEASSPPRELVSPPRGTETILLGEDDDDVRDVTTSVLEEYGYTVIVAKDGEESIRKFSEHQERVQLLILDVVMPKKNGREVYEAVKHLRPGVKVLFTSGYTADIIRSRGTIEEGLHFVRKPVAMPDLLRTIRELLDQ